MWPQYWFMKSLYVAHTPDAPRLLVMSQVFYCACPWATALHKCQGWDLPCEILLVLKKMWIWGLQLASKSKLAMMVVVCLESYGPVITHTNTHMPHISKLIWLSPQFFIRLWRALVSPQLVYPSSFTWYHHLWADWLFIYIFFWRKGHQSLCSSFGRADLWSRYAYHVARIWWVLIICCPGHCVSAESCAEISCHLSSWWHLHLIFKEQSLPLFCLSSDWRDLCPLHMSVTLWVLDA